MDKPAYAVQEFVDGYTDGDADRVVRAFTPEGVVTYNGYRTAGREAIRRSLAMVGKFAFTVERSFRDGSVHTVEGEMIPVVDGERKRGDGIPYAGVAELRDAGAAMMEFRLYYDEKRLGKALDQYGFLK